MKKISIGVAFLAVVAAGWYYAGNRTPKMETYDLLKQSFTNVEDEEGASKEERAFWVKQRWQHDYLMLRDPKTGKIPYNIREEEIAMAHGIPVKGESGLLGAQGPDNLNTYIPAGPTNAGGRTRAAAFDKRYNGGSNKVIISGGISGGIMRSADGGATWTRTSPDDDIHNLAALAQDPRAGSEDTWYAGGGEPIANSANAAGAFYLGYGIWKSTNNGVTWTKLTRQVTDINGTTILGGGALESFDNPLDIIHKLVVNPVNGDLYICGHRRLMRSTNGGTSFNVVFTGTTASTSDVGQMDVVCTSTGKLYLAVNGGLPDADRRGVWTSTNGTSWTRIAGGSSLGVDSVANWRGNDYTGNSKRIVMALAPSNQNLLYITYENGDSQASPSAKTEADLFKYDAGTNTWTNLSANVPDFTGQLDGVDPFHVQGGYDLMVAVKPDDPNTVFLGGVNLFRSTNGFATNANTAWIGGYGSNFPSGLNIYGSQANPNDITKWSHPDMHVLVFDPSNPARALCGNDGGLQITENIMGTAAGVEPVSWTAISNYQTLQYYVVAMDPGSGRNNFIGGAQDNGTRFYDGTGLIGAPASKEAQFRLLSGDGGAAAIAKAGPTSQIVYGSTQFGNIIRATLSTGSATGGSIRPSALTATPGAGSNAFGDFVTYFKLDFDNTEDLYYANFNRLFRTTSASTVSSTSWTELTGVSAAINPTAPATGTDVGITAMETTRGDYNSTHCLFIGTSSGKIFRLDNPRNATATATPVNITPISMTGYISDIAVNPNNDQEVMVVVSNYGVSSIFWTNNAKGATPVWYIAEGNLTLPSVRSCAIVVKKNASNTPVTEYYVGTSVGLYSAVDIGTTLTGAGSVNWVREGGSVLNYAVINSLDYRPQDNTLLVGTHGNGMYFATTGTPNYQPNQNTGLPDPVRNDKNFIKTAYPTIVKNNLVYQTGDMFTVKKLVIQVRSINGQLLLQKESGYTSGEVDTRRLTKGAYILTITSGDYKQQFVRKFVKE